MLPILYSHAFLYNASRLQSFRCFCLQTGSIYVSILNKLKEKLNPVHLEVLNESPQHSVPKNSETHFRIFIVSQKFDEMNLVQRHRLIHKLLEWELKNGIHALAIQAYSINEWNKMQKPAKSPPCLGGSKNTN